MATNFRLNKAQAWHLSNIGHYAEDEEIVINADSYDSEEETFEFAIMPKEQVPDSVWTDIDPYIRDTGWAFFIMDDTGDIAGLDPEE